MDEAQYPQLWSIMFFNIKDLTEHGYGSHRTQISNPLLQKKNKKVYINLLLSDYVVAFSHYFNIVIYDVCTFTVVYYNIPLVFPLKKTAKCLTLMDPLCLSLRATMERFRKSLLQTTITSGRRNSKHRLKGVSLKYVKTQNWALKFCYKERRIRTYTVKPWFWARFVPEMWL